MQSLLPLAVGAFIAAIVPATLAVAIAPLLAVVLVLAIAAVVVRWRALPDWEDRVGVTRRSGQTTHNTRLRSTPTILLRNILSSAHKHPSRPPKSAPRTAQ